VDKTAFLDRIDGIEPSSGTPLVASLLESFNALRELRGGQRVSVLVTDGAESCGGSLQKAVNRARDANTRVIVIGFDIDSPVCCGSSASPQRSRWVRSACTSTRCHRWWSEGSRSAD